MRTAVQEVVKVDEPSGRSPASTKPASPIRLSRIRWRSAADRRSEVLLAVEDDCVIQIGARKRKEVATCDQLMVKHWPLSLTISTAVPQLVSSDDFALHIQCDYSLI